MGINILQPFSIEDARQLLQITGIDDEPTILNLCTWLNRERGILNAIPNFGTILENERLALRKGLMELSKGDLLGKAIKGFEGIDEDVSWQIALSYEEADSNQSGTSQLNSDLVALVRLNTRLKDAEMMAKNKGGRPAVRASLKAAQLLAEKYVELTGEKFKWHEAKAPEGRSPWKRKGTPQSTKFVAAGLKLLYPKIDDPQIRSVVSKVKRTTNL